MVRYLGRLIWLACTKYNSEDVGDCQLRGCDETSIRPRSKRSLYPAQAARLMTKIPKMAAACTRKVGKTIMATATANIFTRSSNLAPKNRKVCQLVCFESLVPAEKWAAQW